MGKIDMRYLQKFLFDICDYHDNRSRESFTFLWASI